MNSDSSYLQGIDEAITKGTHATRLQALWHATDLLIAGQYNEDQIWVFGELISRLAGEIEEAARVELAKRLARIDQDPTKILHELAFDDRIDVAGPILKQASSLSTEFLVQNARAKSQQHLLAISHRKSIPLEVTDVLVSRGNTEVVRAVARNDGATFSNSSFLHLVKRSENDSILAENLGRRVDVPRHIFQQLIAKASDEVRQKLLREQAVERAHGRDRAKLATYPLQSVIARHVIDGPTLFCARSLWIARLHRRPTYAGASSRS